jgi:hypothetical protein
MTTKKAVSEAVDRALEKAFLNPSSENLLVLAAEAFKDGQFAAFKAVGGLMALKPDETVADWMAVLTLLKREDLDPGNAAVVKIRDLLRLELEDLTKKPS